MVAKSKKSAAKKPTKPVRRPVAKKAPAKAPATKTKSSPVSKKAARPVPKPKPKTKAKVAPKPVKAADAKAVAKKKPVAAPVKAQKQPVATKAAVAKKPAPVARPAPKPKEAPKPKAPLVSVRKSPTAPPAATPAAPVKSRNLKLVQTTPAAKPSKSEKTKAAEIASKAPKKAVVKQVALKIPLARIPSAPKPIDLVPEYDDKAAQAVKVSLSNLGISGISPYEIRAGEDYMNEKQLAHFRQILVAWKQVLMEEVDRIVDHMQDEAANFPDPNDRATQEEEFSLALRARDRERKLIKKIDEAIDKVDHHEYGYCDGCGVEIGVRRLEARPTATLCIDCKTLEEIKERQMGG